MNVTAGRVLDSLIVRVEQYLIFACSISITFGFPPAFRTYSTKKIDLIVCSLPIGSGESANSLMTFTSKKLDGDIC